MVDTNKPHISFNVVAGGRKNGYPFGDAWAIVTKGLPRTSLNQSGEVMHEIIGQHEGREKLRDRMGFYARKEKLDLAS